MTPIQIGTIIVLFIILFMSMIMLRHNIRKIEEYTWNQKEHNKNMFWVLIWYSLITTNLIILFFAVDLKG